MTSIVFTQFDDGLTIDENKVYWINKSSTDTGLQEIHKLCLFPFKLKEYLSKLEHQDGKFQIEDILNSKTTKEYTPLILTCMNKVYESVKLLLEYKTDINLQNCHGCTALMYACDTNIKITKLLLEYGADINIQTYYIKKTALHYASESKNINYIKLLLQYQYDFSVYTYNLSYILINIITIISNINNSKISYLKKMKKLTHFDYDSILLYEIKKCVFSQPIPPSLDW